MQRVSGRGVLLLSIVVMAQLATALLARSDARLWQVFPLWLLSLSAALLVAHGQLPRPAPPRLNPRNPEIWTVLGLTILAALLRLPRLETLPAGIYGDEGEFGTLALSISRGAGPNPFGVAFLGDPALYVHIIAPFVGWLGPTMEAIRLPSALIGVATIPLFYGLVRNLYGRFPASIAAFLLATSAVHIHFSRLALNVIWVPFFTCLSLWLLKRALAERRDSWFLLTGIAGGIGFYFHFGARLILPMLCAALAAQCLVARHDWRVWTRALGLITVGALLALSPLLANLSNNPELLTAHTNKRGIWNHWDDLAARYGTDPADKVGILWEQVRHTFFAFVTEPDSFYGAFMYRFMERPLLPAAVAALASLGLVVLLLQMRSEAARLALLWFAVPCLFASILTDVAGQAHRLLNPTLALLLAAALAIEVARHYLQARVPAPATGVLLALLLAIPLVSGLRDSYAYMRPGATDSFAVSATAQARCLEALPPESIAVVDGAPRIYARHGPSRYLANTVVRRDLKEPFSDLPADPNRMLILVHEWNHADVERLLRLYPDAPWTEIQRPAGRRALTVIAVFADAGEAAERLAACKAKAEI